MGIGAGTAAVIGAVIGAGSAIYSGTQQSKAKKEAKSAQEQAQFQAQEEARRADEQARALAGQRPAEEAATVQFGADEDTQVGSANDFLVRRDSTGTSGLGGRDTGSGLGFKV